MAGCGGDSDDLLTRRNVVNLSASERQAFVETLYAMKNTPSAYDPMSNAYDYFVSTHNTAFSSHYNAHMCAGFLPWHREFLLRFERELQRVSGNADMTLPYWNWHEPGSYKLIFTPDFLGDNGDPNDQYLVKTGAFREGLWAMGADFDDTPDEFSDTDGDGNADVFLTRLSHRGLTRCYGYQNRYRDSLSIVDEYMSGQPLDELLKRQSYDAAPFMESMLDAEERADKFDAFNAVSMRKYLERVLHNPVHAMIGGQMGTATSPNDPAFFLHHANVDRLWDVWQGRYGNEGYPTLQESPMSGLGARLDVYTEVVRVEDTFDLARHSGVRYEA